MSTTPSTTPTAAKQTSATSPASARGHHTLKHNTAWTVRQLPGGVLEWTSPTGRIYIDTPVSTIEFAPDPEHEIPNDPIPASTTRVPEELDPDDIDFDELQFDPLELIPF